MHSVSASSAFCSCQDSKLQTVDKITGLNCIIPDTMQLINISRMKFPAILHVFWVSWWSCKGPLRKSLKPAFTVCRQ